VTLRRVAVAFTTGALFVVGLAVRSELVFGIVVLAAVFVPLERVFALHREQRVLRRGWRTDLVHLVVDNAFTTALLVVAVVVAGSLLRALTPAGVRSGIVGMPAGAQFLLGFGIAEVSHYWAHRATHRVPWLWRFHQVHHSIVEMDWLAAARLHPVDQAFTRACTVLPLYALGFSRLTFGGFVFVATLQALFVHANVRLRFGPLRYVVATPEFHHWHHGDVPEAYDKNFAGELPLLDLVFGTLHLPKRAWPAAYGVRGADVPPPDGYLAQLAWPFRSA
jgi:sterol desaturase/sphingolipid hydroxylase (fatty acid hydroxylase superfamily)